MNYSIETNSKKNNLELLITKGLRNRIKELDLIDTGTMLSTTVCYISYKDDGLDIKVQSTDYYMYMDSEFNITNYIIETQQVSNMLDDLFGDMIMDIIMED